MWHEDKKHYLLSGQQLNQILAMLQMISDRNPDIEKLNEFIRNLKDLRAYNDILDEFIFSEDVADAAIFMLKNTNRLDNTHYNVGTGVDTSIRELASMIANKVSFKGEIKWDLTRHDGRQKKLLDSAKIKQLGWDSSVSLEYGLQSTYKWYLQNLES